MAKFLSLLFLLVLLQLSTCQEAPNCSALEMPYSGSPFSGEPVVAIPGAFKIARMHVVEALPPIELAKAGHL